jgi:hypothetical protein
MIRSAMRSTALEFAIDLQYWAVGLELTLLDPGTMLQILCQAGMLAFWICVCAVIRYSIYFVRASSTKYNSLARTSCYSRPLRWESGDARNGLPGIFPFCTSSPNPNVCLVVAGPSKHLAR